MPAQAGIQYTQAAIGVEGPAITGSPLERVLGPAKPGPSAGTIPVMIN
jgi:hypothetical protein